MEPTQKKRCPPERNTSLNRWQANVLTKLELFRSVGVFETVLRAGLLSSDI